MKALSRGFLGRAFFITIADAAQKGSTAILSLILARFLGPSEFGVFAAVTAASGVIMLSTSIGFEQEMVRRSARSPLSEMLSLTHVLVAITVGVAIVTFGVYRGLVSGSVVPIALLLIAFSVDAVCRFHLPYRYAGIILGETHVGAVIHSVATVVLVSLTLLVLWIARSVAMVLWVQLGVAILTLAAWELWRRSKHIGHALPAGGLSEAKGFVQGALSFAFTNILWVLYFNIGVVMMTSLRSSGDVGVFSAVYRMVAMTFIFAYAVTSAYGPSLFKAAHEEPARHRPLAVKMMLTLVGVGAVVSLGLAFCSPFIINLVMGPAFLAGVEAAQWLSIAAFLRALNFGFSEILTTGGRHPWRIGLEGGLLAVYVGLNWLWIPIYGPVGGARAAVAAEAAMTVAGFALWWAMSRRQVSGR